MNLKQKIEEWEKFKKQPLKYIEAVKTPNFEQTMESSMQALKEAADLMEIFLRSDDHFIARTWLKKWGFE